MDAARHESRTPEELIAEIDSLRAQVASLTSRLVEADAGPRHSAGRSDATGLARDFVSSLRQGEERFHACLDNMLDCFAILSTIRGADGQIVDFRYDYINQAGCRSDGRSLEDHIGRTLLEVLPNHRTSGLFDAYCRLVEAGEPVERESVEYADQLGQQYVSSAFDVRAWKLDDGFAVAWRDVTQRKRTERDLLEANERFRAVLEQSLDVAHRRNLQTDRYEYISPVCQEMGGYSAGEMSDMTLEQVLSCVHPDDRDGVKAAVAKALDSGSARLQYRWRHKNGQWRHLADFLTVAKGPDGQPLYLNGVARDVTDYKQAQEALRQSEQRYRSLVEVTSDWVWSVGPDGRYTYASPRVKDLLGYEPHEVLGRTPFDFMLPEEARRVRPVFEAAARSRQPIKGLENINVRKDGRKVALETSGEPILDGAGNLLGYHGIDRDISERKRAEEALRVKESAIACSLNAIAIADLQGRLTYVNPATVRLWGYEDEREVLGQSVLDFWAEPQRAAEVVQAVQEGRNWTGELVGLRKDRARLDLHLSASTVLNDAGTPVCIMASFVDMTEPRRAERALRESEERLRLTVETAELGLFDGNMRTGEIYMSPQLKQHIGYPDDELPNRLEEFEQRLHPEDHDRIMQGIRQYLADPYPGYQVEFRLRHRDGTYRTILTRAGLVADETGVLCRMIGTHMDITERKRSEQALADEKRFVEALFASLPGTAFVFDARGRRIRWNDYCTETLGWSDDDMRQLGACDIITPRDRQRCAQAFQEAFVNGHAEVELTALAKDGREMPFFFNSVRTIFAGEPYVVAVGIDISDRKRAEEQLQELNATLEQRVVERTADLRRREEEYRSLFEGVPVGVYRTTIDGRILRLNPEALNMLGYTDYDSLPGNATAVYVNPADRQRFIRLLKAKGTIRDFEVQMRRPDGSVIWVHSTASLVRDKAGHVRYIEGSLLDVTERKQAAESLAEAHRSLRATLEAIPDVMFEVDGHGRIHDYHAPRADMLYVPPETFLGRTVQEVLPADAAAVILESLAQAQAEGKSRGASYALDLPDGRRWFELSVVAKSGGADPHSRYLALVRDITERKQAEEALRESEVRFRTLVEDAPVGIGISRDGVTLYANRAYLRMFGFQDLDEVLGEPLANRWSPECRAIIHERARQRSRGLPVPAEYEGTAQRKDGSQFPAHVTTTTVDLHDGKATIGFIADLTERKRAEEALRQRNRYIETVLEQAPIGFAVHTIDDGVGRFVSGRFEEIYGVARGAIDSHYTFFDKVWPDHPEFREQIRRRVVDDMTSGDAGRMRWENVPVFLRSGETRHITAINIPLIDQNLMVSTVQDVTERVRAEEAMRASEAKYRALIEDINDIAYSVDAEGRLTYVSPQVARYGWTAEEMVGHSFLEFAAPQDRERMFAEFSQTLMGTEFASEFRMQAKAGRTHWFEDHGRAVRDQAGRILGMRGVLRDVTDRKEAQEANELYAQRVRQLAVKLSLAEEQERRRLAAVLHDDLVQILVAMRMKFAVLRRAKDEPVRLREIIEEIESLVTRSTQVARSLMSELSHRALYETGFVPAAQWLAEDIQRLYGMKVRLADDGRPKPIAEPLRVLLYQCLRELLANAAKHAKVTEAHVWIRREGSVVRVLVEDQGVGFDPSTVAPKPDGSGFGLFSIEERLEPLGGKVEIRSAPGQGTSVLLEVPVENDGR